MSRRKCRPGTSTASKAGSPGSLRSPAVSKSSLKMQRGFCRDCGTPLYNNWIANDVIHPAIATLDEPSSVQPEFQIGIEARLSWTNEVSALKAMTTDDIFKGYEALL